MCVCVCEYVPAWLASAPTEPYWGFVNSWLTSRLCCSEVCLSVGKTWVHMRWCGASRSTWEGQTTMKSQTLMHQRFFFFIYTDVLQVSWPVFIQNRWRSNSNQVSINKSSWINVLILVNILILIQEQLYLIHFDEEMTAKLALVVHFVLCYTKLW